MRAGLPQDSRAAWQVAAKGISVAEKRVSKWLAPGVAPRVKRAEVGAEVPVTPAHAEPLGLEPYEPCPLQPGCHAGLLVAAELADEQRAAMAGRPGRRLSEVITDCAPVSVISPRGAQPLISPGPPRRALVGELERRVVVHTDHQAFIIRQLKLRKRADVIHPRRADDHGPPGITLADDGQCQRDQLVPRTGCHRGARLVEQLEVQPAGPVGVARRDLPPQAEKPEPLPARRVVQLVIVVDVEHDIQIPAQSLVDRPVDPLEKHRADRIRRGLPGMSRPPHRQADRVEPGVAYLGEKPLQKPEARIALADGIQGITKADSAPKTVALIIAGHTGILTYDADN